MPDRETVGEEKKPVNWPVRLAKISFVIAAFMLVMFAVLSNLGGNSDTLKGSIEGFIADATGHWVEIETLNQMSFFPAISFDFENLELRPSEYEEPIIEVGKAYLSMGFGDVVFRSGKISGFHLENIKTRPDSIIQPAINLDRLAILYKPEVDEAFLSAEGKIGKEPLSAEVAMEAVGAGKGLKYKFLPQPPFQIKLGDVEISGNFNNRGTSLSLENLQLKNGGEVASGTLHMARGEKITGQLKITDLAKFMESFKKLEQVFYPGQKSWNIPPFDLDVEYEGERGSLVWDGEHCEGRESVQDLFTLPGFTCGDEESL